MAIPSVTYTFTNSTVADATEVNTNFNNIISSLTDGTSDHSISTLTLAGALTANGNVTLGNASGDTMTVNATPTFVNATTFSSTTTFNGAPTFNAAVTVGAYDFTVNTDTFFVDASEDSVGIGTTSPSGSFHINTDPTGDCDVNFECAGGSDVNLIFSETDPTNPLFSIQYAGSAGSNPNNLFKIRTNTTGSGGINLDALTIAQNGQIGIGTSPTGLLHIYDDDTTSAIGTSTSINRIKLEDGSGATGVGAGFSIDAEGVYGGLGRVAIVKDNSLTSGGTRDFGRISFIVNSNSGVDSYNAFVERGKVNSTGVVTVSDVSQKTNIVDLSMGLSEVMQLTPRYFDWKGTDKSQPGLIAQEVELVIPEAVSGTGEQGDLKGLHAVCLIAVLTKAIQEQQAEIDSLKARLDALESV